MSNSTTPISSPSLTSTPLSSVPPSSSEPLSSSPVSTTPSPTTSTATAPTSIPPSTQVLTSVVTASPSAPSSQPPTTVIVTTGPDTTSSDTSSTDTSSSTSTSSSSTAVNAQSKGSHNHGLSPGGTAAIAVVIPVVVVALLIIAALFLWRRRKQRKGAEEERKREMEEYGYNPNHDPTLPAVAANDEITEDQSAGYRGWGTTSNTTRKASTTMSGGNTQPSDGGYHSPGSPTQGASVSDQNSDNPLVGQRPGPLEAEAAAGGLAAGAAAGAGGVKRGPSNASSAYSAGDRSANSGEGRPANVNGPQEYYTDNAYYQPGPYENPYNGGQQPVIRDNPARRNTRIEKPDVFPHQGTSGIAQNF